MTLQQPDSEHKQSQNTSDFRVHPPDVNVPVPDRNELEVNEL